MIQEIVDSILARILADEVRDCVPLASRWLISRAVNRLPERHRERFSEEWSSHVEATPGTISTIFACAGFVVASRRMEGTFRHSFEAEQAEKLVQWLEQASLGYIAEVILEDRPELRLVRPESRDHFVNEYIAQYVRDGGLTKVANTFHLLRGKSKQPKEHDLLMREAVREEVAKKLPAISARRAVSWIARYRSYRLGKKYRKLVLELNRIESRIDMVAD